MHSRLHSYNIITLEYIEELGFVEKVEGATDPVRAK